jgi:hypothetical protein
LTKKNKVDLENEDDLEHMTEKRKKEVLSKDTIDDQSVSIEVRSLLDHRQFTKPEASNQKRLNIYIYIFMIKHEFIIAIAVIN